MKKIVVCLLLFTQIISKNSQGQSSEIAYNMSQFNVKQHEASLKNLQERRWWQTVLNVITVVAADIGGAYAGAAGTIHVAGAIGLATGGVGVGIVAGVSAIIGGAGASNGAYHSVFRGPANQVNYGNFTINLPREFMIYSQIGRQHNEVLHNNYFLGQNLSDYYNPLLDDQQRAIIDRPEIQENFRFLAQLGSNYIQNGSNFDYFTSELVSKNLMTTHGKTIMDSFIEKYKTCASPQDMESFINYSINEVYISNLDLKEKRSLIAAFIVAAESPFYQNPIPKE